MKLTINGKPYLRFEILTLDVWGNARIGFDVNHMFATNELITLPEQWTARDVVLALKRADVLKRNVRHTSVGVDGGSDFLLIEDARTGEPLVYLRAVV